MNVLKIILIGAVSTYVFFGVVIYFIQEALIFFPETLGSKYQYKFDSNFKERNFEVSEGVIINAVHFKVEQPKGLIYYHHGNAGSLARWGDVAEYFVGFGYDVLIYDYRGFGKSTGKRSMSSMYQDAQFIYESIAQEYPEGEIIVYGRSLGSGLATRVAADNDPGKLILETPYYSLSDIAVRHYPIYPHKYLLKYPFPSYKYINQVSCPIYIFHGTDDNVVDYASGEKLFNHARRSTQIEMITIEGGDHNDLIDFEDYRLGIQKIL